MGGGLDKGFRTSSQRNRNLSYFFFEIVTRGGKWEKRILSHLSDIPRKPFWGAATGEHGLSAAILQYETQGAYL